MKEIKHLRTNAIRIAVIIPLLIPYSFSFGDEEASLTVENATSHYLHVIMNGESFLSIGPGRTASLSADGQTTIFVQAFYAPGQGIEGTAENSFVIGGTAGAIIGGLASKVDQYEISHAVKRQEAK